MPFIVSRSTRRSSRHRPSDGIVDDRRQSTPATGGAARAGQRWAPRRRSCEGGRARAARAARPQVAAPSDGFVPRPLVNRRSPVNGRSSSRSIVPIARVSRPVSSLIDLRVSPRAVDMERRQPREPRDRREGQWSERVAQLQDFEPRGRRDALDRPQAERPCQQSPKVGEPAQERQVLAKVVDPQRHVRSTLEQLGDASVSLVRQTLAEADRRLVASAAAASPPQHRATGCPASGSHPEDAEARLGDRCVERGTRPRARTRACRAGSMTPSSHSRAVE